MSLALWRPAAAIESCSWCLFSRYRAALPDDVPLTLVHELVLLLEREERRGVALRWLPFGSDDDLHADREPANTLNLWRIVLAAELRLQRPVVERALNLYLRPALDSWIDQQGALLDVAARSTLPN
ncbi:hypothetical protein C3B59_17355 [Cryobacterium zongtaii]|uniref:Uncharacterized protein n=2 Tax=Cryobacterium zongtaii TaxID=1259217 RepID=A0A2S3Z624_9MICO|nr:hypothetical protein C3B59_17355 [Cryobacterium zongtaii]